MPIPEDAPTLTQEGEAVTPAPPIPNMPGLSGTERALPLPPEFSAERYEIGEELGRGGMGLIRRATEATTGRDVAMKVMLRPRSEGQLRRFLNEARITATLTHPSIVPLYELGADPKGHAYYTMKLVEGVTLRAVLDGLREGSANITRVWTLSALLTAFQKACDAIAFAHSRGVIHRDLKPANIMLGGFGEVLVMDWGLAKQMKDENVVQGEHEEISTAGSDVTQDGAVIGSPVYMSPEQASGRINEVRPSSDIYALGAILYEILALRPPVSGQDSSEVIEKVRAGRIDSLSGVRSGVGGTVPALRNARQREFAHLPGGAVPSSLAAVAMKALALNPADRYESVPALQKEIAAYQAGFATKAENAGFLKQFGFLLKRHAAASIAVGISLILLSGLSLVFVSRVIAERNRASQALSSLRKTAPTFREQSRVLIEAQRLGEALEKADYAISVDPADGESYALKADIFQALAQIQDARLCYEQALAHGDRTERTSRNLELCRVITRDHLDQDRITPKGLRVLMEDLQAQSRNSEALAIAQRIGERRSATQARWYPLLEPSFGLSRAETEDAFRVDEDGKINVVLKNFTRPPVAGTSLKGMPIQSVRVEKGEVVDFGFLAGTPLKNAELIEVRVQDLTFLFGAPLENLTIWYAPISDLGPLKGMPLRTMALVGSAITDVSPLRGAKITKLHLPFSTKLLSIEPLKGMPLRELHIQHCRKISDLSPLSGMPMEALIANETAVSDISPLKGMPFKWLELEATKIKSIEPLRKMPLKRVSLARCASLYDISALADCVELEEVCLPPSATGVEMLRSHPTLRRISSDQGSEPRKKLRPVAEFFAEYDAANAGRPR